MEMETLPELVMDMLAPPMATRVGEEEAGGEKGRAGETIGECLGGGPAGALRDLEVGSEFAGGERGYLVGEGGRGGEGGE